MSKTLKFSVLFLLFTIFSFFCISMPSKTISASTEDKYIGKVQLGGDTIGIQIKTNVEIVGKYEVDVNDSKIKPWENSNIQDGDYIYSIENCRITCNNDLNDIVKNTKKEVLNIVLLRKNELVTTKINVIKNSNNKNSIGLYIKDHITGVGTLTFINLETNKFGALGHSVNDALSNGILYTSTIKGIKKAIKGVPGEKFAMLSNNKIGTIEKNNSIGIFGEINYENKNEIVNVLNRNYIELGPAQIVTVINGNIINKFNIEIVEVNKQDNTSIKGIKFKVIDSKLIEDTGGIIQGMSGSPIIQNGDLVGAVSHVMVNDPIYGYGVFAEWMYYETK